MQGIIIQGPTNYCKEIIDCYVDIPNVVFSTWNDEPKENIDYLKSKGMDVIQSSKPTFSGYLNINYQTLSTFAGIQYLEDKGIEEDMSNINRYLQRFATKIVQTYTFL